MHVNGHRKNDQNRGMPVMTAMAICPIHRTIIREMNSQISFNVEQSQLWVFKKSMQYHSKLREGMQCNVHKRTRRSFMFSVSDQVMTNSFLHFKILHLYFQKYVTIYSLNFQTAYRLEWKEFLRELFAFN